MPGHTAIHRVMLAAGALAILAACGPALHTQTYSPTAIKRADLQIGGGYSLGHPDYSPQTLMGVTGYAVYDFTPHFGISLDFHQVNTHGDNHIFDIYERTYEVGPRYVRHYGRFHPYARASYGRGVFNFPDDRANLAYNIVAGAAGVDIRVQRHVNVRAEFESQYWMKFLDRGLQPDIVTIGAAYHF